MNKNLEEINTQVNRVREMRTPPKVAAERVARQDPEEVIPFDDGNQETLSGF